MSNPQQLFEISRVNPLVNHFINYWTNGYMEWEDMLISLAKELERQCNNIVDRNNLRELFIKDRFLNLPVLVLEESLIPNLDDINDKLLRQEKLISAIVYISDIQTAIYKIILNKSTFDTIKCIRINRKNISDFNLLIVEEINDENI